MKIVLRILFMVLLSVSVHSKDWGELPDGFTWYQSNQSKTVIPLPDGWFVKEESKKGTRVLFITKENIDTEGRFMTGYTQNYIKKFTKHSNTKPTAYALAYILKIQENHAVLKEPWVKDLAHGIKGFGIRHRLYNDGNEIIIHTYIVADESDDSIRITWFEAPSEMWDDAWKYGEVMLSNAKLWK